MTLFAQDIEDSFHANEKAGVVLLDLTAAYDTMWHCGLHLKLLQMTQDRQMVKFIMEMLSNRSFILKTSDGQQSRLRRLKNGVPQGPVVSPLLFNIYIHDLPGKMSWKYRYADDLDNMLSLPSWKTVSTETWASWQCTSSSGDSNSALGRQRWQHSTSTAKKPNENWTF